MVEIIIRKAFFLFFPPLCAPAVGRLGGGQSGRIGSSWQYYTLKTEKSEWLPVKIPAFFQADGGMAAILSQFSSAG
ncbi:MAG: hypothetical protein MR910_02200 [Clostridiales bacterium]|nr:hypothetical protein [Clostridiales bacterium]